MITQELLTSIRWKFSRYTREQCNFALLDIRETERALGRDHHDTDYIEKLQFERDAALDRLRALEGKKTCPCCNGNGSIPENA